jgi:hypothetical protein
LVALSILLWAAPTLGGDVKDDYLQRFRALQQDDVDGHIELARWCRKHESWTELKTQCRHVLRIKPGHREAELLLELANEMLDGGDQSGGRAAEPGRSGDGSRKKLRILTDEEVQAIRRAELDLDRPERVTVKFDRNLMRDFMTWARSEGGAGFDRKAFSRLPIVTRTQVILGEASEQFGDRITIKTDPYRMRTFIREVWPIIGRGCATSGCHGDGAVGRLRLHGGRSIKTNPVYTNFLILHEYEADGERLIDRNDPSRSLLLAYGLSPDAADEPPKHEHPAVIDPIFDSPEDRNYQGVLQWLNSLSIDRPDYGIDLDSGK